MYETTDFRKGLRIEYKGQPWTIISFQHVNPGKGSAFVRTRLKNLETAQVLEVTFKAGVDRVGIPDLQVRPTEYLYREGDNFNFMDNENYEQYVLTAQELDDNLSYLKEGSAVKITFYNGKPVACEIDTFVELEIAEAQPNIKGDTSSGGGKPVTTVTGLTLTAPFHIKKGDVVRIDTRSGSYVEKVK